MDSGQFLNLLEDLLELPKDSLRGPESLEHFQAWDSIAMMSFVALAKEHCGVTVSARQLGDCSTVNDLLRLVGLSQPATA